MHHMNHNYCPLLSYYLPFIVEEIDSEKFNDLSKVAKRMSGKSRFPTHRAKLQTLKYLLFFIFTFLYFIYPFPLLVTLSHHFCPGSIKDFVT